MGKQRFSLDLPHILRLGNNRGDTKGIAVTSADLCLQLPLASLVHRAIDLSSGTVATATSGGSRDQALVS
jgi:hypothetical protein